MQIGVAYYPEHWPAERWPVDAQLMREAGVDVVRVGEFAWSSLEPSATAMSARRPFAGGSSGVTAPLSG